MSEPAGRATNEHRVFSARQRRELIGAPWFRPLESPSKVMVHR